MSTYSISDLVFRGWRYGMEKGEFEDSGAAGADYPGNRVLFADGLGAARRRLDDCHFK